MDRGGTAGGSHLSTRAVHRYQCRRPGGSPRFNHRQPLWSKCLEPVQSGSSGYYQSRRSAANKSKQGTSANRRAKHGFGHLRRCQHLYQCRRHRAWYRLDRDLYSGHSPAIFTYGENDIPLRAAAGAVVRRCRGDIELRPCIADKDLYLLCYRRGIRDRGRNMAGICGQGDRRHYRMG
ncbi:MAG: hypothetical protein DDT26_01902 [Dehalococcoidia bacterium]|nr:hypothetical protein [Chloroflexota bacterium]